MTPLRQRMINDMTVRGLAESTRASYLRSVTRLARHYRRSPEQISAREVQDYLPFLHQQHGLSWSTCNTIRHGVRFFFRITLGLPDPHFYVPGAKEPSTLPQILNHDELVRLFTVTTNLKHCAVLMTAYAAGLRASELGRLQVSDIDSDRMCLRINQGKGNKDRYVPLSPRLLELLREYWRRDRPQHWLFPTRPLDRPMSRQTPTRIYQAAKDNARIGKAGGIHTLQTWLCQRAARGRRGAARHSAPARAYLHPLDHALPASGSGQDLCHPVSIGPAGVPVYRPGLSRGPCQPPGPVHPASAGGRRHPARVRRLLSANPSALGPATARRERAGELPHRRARRVQGVL